MYFLRMAMVPMICSDRISTKTDLRTIQCTSTIGPDNLFFTLIVRLRVGMEERLREQSVRRVHIFMCSTIIQIAKTIGFPAYWNWSDNFPFSPEELSLPSDWQTIPI